MGDEELYEVLTAVKGIGRSCYLPKICSGVYPFLPEGPLGQVTKHVAQSCRLLLCGHCAVTALTLGMMQGVGRWTCLPCSIVGASISCPLAIWLFERGFRLCMI